MSSLLSSSHHHPRRSRHISIGEPLLPNQTQQQSSSLESSSSSSSNKGGIAGYGIRVKTQWQKAVRRFSLGGSGSSSQLPAAHRKRHQSLNISSAAAAAASSGSDVKQLGVPHHKPLQKAESSPLPERKIATVTDGYAGRRRGSQPEDGGAASVTVAGERPPKSELFPYSLAFTYSLGTSSKSPFPCGSEGVMINSSLAHEAFQEEKARHNAAAALQHEAMAADLNPPLSTEQQRKRAASLSTPHRGSDIQIDPVESAFLFRSVRGLPVSDPFLEKEGFHNLKKDERKLFVKFFIFHKCYDLIPTSAKLVVFDTQLLVKKAFFALVYNGVRAAPLWDSQRQKFVGMLTITDFIRTLRTHYKDPAGSAGMEELEEHKLETWKASLDENGTGSGGIIWISPDASLYDAIRTLIQNKIHRLPVIEPFTGNVLYILTHKRLLRFLFLYVHDLPTPAYFEVSIGDLGIGSYDDILTAGYESPIIEALSKFVDRRISALPIVDGDGKLLDIYAKFDVFNLAAEKTYSNLDISLKEANERRNEWFEGVYTCKKTDTLFHVMEVIVKAEVHRLVVVDDGTRVIGVISLSDILAYLVSVPERKT